MGGLKAGVGDDAIAARARLGGSCAQDDAHVLVLSEGEAGGAGRACAAHARHAHAHAGDAAQPGHDAASASTAAEDAAASTTDLAK